MYLQIQGKTREEAIEEASEDAESGLRREAVLAAVADAEEIEVTEEDLLEALRPPAGEKGKPEKLLKRLRADGRDGLLAEEIRMRKAADLVAEEAKPIEMDRAEAREKLWTPEGEREGRQPAPGISGPPASCRSRPNARSGRGAGGPADFSVLNLCFGILQPSPLDDSKLLVLMLPTVFLPLFLTLPVIRRFPSAPSVRRTLNLLLSLTGTDRATVKSIRLA